MSKNKLINRIIHHGKNQYASKRQRKIAWNLTRQQVELLFQDDLFRGPVFNLSTSQVILYRHRSIGFIPTLIAMRSAMSKLS
jgi:hypothetical protein